VAAGRVGASGGRPVRWTPSPGFNHQGHHHESPPCHINAVSRQKPNRDASEGGRGLRADTFPAPPCSTTTLAISGRSPAAIAARPVLAHRARPRLRRSPRVPVPHDPPEAQDETRNFNSASAPQDPPAIRRPRHDAAPLPIAMGRGWGRGPQGLGERTSAPRHSYPPYAPTFASRLRRPLCRPPHRSMLDIGSLLASLFAARCSPSHVPPPIGREMPHGSRPDQPDNPVPPSLFHHPTQ
jgi:hypothetical protein